MRFIKKTISKTKFHISKIGQESIVTIFGIAMEYYSIFLYGYLASVIISHFFTKSSPLIVILAMLLSYIMGPLGAILCGHVGDTLGRKKILAWTLAFVAIPSFLISILPTYDQIGVAASILFIILRSVQTLALGGDIIGLVTFVLEEVPAKRRGLFGGFMSMGSALGVVFSSLVLSLFDPFEDPNSQWKWRILISIGIFGLIVAIYFYRIFGETKTFSHYEKKNYLKTSPLIDLFKTSKLLFLKIIGITALVPIITIVIFGFVPYLGMTHLGLSHKISMWSNTLALLLFAIAAPIFGTISDKIGRRPILFAVALTFLILGFPLFYLLDHGGHQMFFLIQLFFALVASAYYGVTFAICIEHFPTHIRYTGVALGYYFTYAVFGGINGLYLIKLLLKDIHLDISPVFYLILGSLIVLISIFLLKEEAGHQLSDK